MSNNRMTDRLDAEIEEMEALMKGGQPEAEGVEEEEVIDVEVAEDTEDIVEESIEETAEVLETSQDDTEDEEDKPKRVNWKNLFTESDNRYKKLRASSDGKLFQLRQQLTGSGREIESLSQKIDLLTKRIAEVAADTKLDTASYFEPEDRDILGDKAIEAISRVSKELASREVAPIREELAERKKQDRIRAQEDAEYNLREADRIFRSNIKRQIANYEDIDTDPGFMDYLNDSDPVNGNTRFYWFKDAQKRGDVKSAVDYFKDYSKLTRKPTDMLDRKITPTGQGRGTEAPKKKGEVEWIAASDVERFHNDVTSGNFKGTREQRDFLDDKFDRALAEGRINFRV